jgi:hypothetical protein
MQILYWVDRTKALLEVQSPAFCARCGPNGAPASRDFDLRRAKTILPRGKCSLLNEQAFRLEKEFELDHGFHRTPLVPGCLEPLQYVSPGVARSAQTHPPNKTYGLCCAAQYYWGAVADMQFWINWKVRHEHLTSCRCPSSIVGCPRCPQRAAMPIGARRASNLATKPAIKLMMIIQAMFTTTACVSIERAGKLRGST